MVLNGRRTTRGAGECSPLIISSSASKRSSRGGRTSRNGGGRSALAAQYCGGGACTVTVRISKTAGTLQEMDRSESTTGGWCKIRSPCLGSSTFLDGCGTRKYLPAPPEGERHALARRTSSNASARPLTRWIQTDGYFHVKYRSSSAAPMVGTAAPAPTALVCRRNKLVRRSREQRWMTLTFQFQALATVT
jgi:hypothetical protein